MAVCFSYCVPEYSSYQIREQLDVFGDLEQKLSAVGPHVDKLCFGMLMPVLEQNRLFRV